MRAYDRAGRVSSVVQHDFNYDPTAMGVFSITGVTGGADSIGDICLTSGSSPTFAWGASSNADSYDVTVYQIDGTTVACATQNTTSTTFSPTGCTLASGSYKLSVEAKRTSGSTLIASGGLYDFIVDATAASANTTITGTTPVVANGTATSTVTVTLLNASMCPLQGVTPTFSATDTGSTNTYGGCSVSNASGVSTCTLASTRAESKTLSLTTPIAVSGGSVIFTHGPAVSLLFAQQPSTSTVAGVDFAQQPLVHIVDAHGNRITSGVDSTAQVTLSITTGTGSLNGTAVATASDGIATFSGLDMTAAGAKVMTATKQDLSGSGGIGTLTQASNGFTITHAAANQLVFTTAPATHAKFSTAFNPQGIVQVRDAFGNVVDTGVDSSATIAISKHSGPGTLSGTLTEAASSGTADFSGNGISSDTIGTIVIRATKPDLTGSGGVGVLTADATIIITPISCDSGDFTTTCTVTTVQDVPNGATINANNLTITNTGQLRNLNNMQDFTIALTGDLSINGASRINANVQITAVNMNFTGTPADVAACSASINASGLGGLGGHRTGNSNITGQGSGGGTCFNAGSGTACSGASHAGLGGESESGATVAAVYGSSSLANSYGSGGGGAGTYAAGGSGGGRIRLVASGTISTSPAGHIAGVCGGSGAVHGNVNGAGGSGGSIYVEASSFSGDIRLVARGGNSGMNLTPSYRGSGGGAGGYIKVVSPRLLSSTRVYLMGLSGSHDPGEDGIYEHTVANWSTALCDSGDLSTTCTVSSTKYVPAGSNITGSGNLIVASGGHIINYERLKDVSLNLTGNLTVNAGGTMTGNFWPISATNITVAGTVTSYGVGYPGASGWNGGTSRGIGAGPGGGIRGEDSGTFNGGGGGYGGAGGRGRVIGSDGGSTYGSATNPTDYGSGGATAGLGGYDGAGTGGGRLDLRAANTLSVTGNINSTGSPGNSGAVGGGSGGTLRLTADTLAITTFSTRLEAVGAQGEPGANGGGAGGGGRIWIDPSTKIYLTNGWNPSGDTGAFSRIPGKYSAGTAGGRGTLSYEYATADSICDSGTLNTTCYVEYAKWIPDGYTVSGTGNLVIGSATAWQGRLFNSDTEARFTISMGGDVTILDHSGVWGNVTINATNLSLGVSSLVSASGLGHVGGNSTNASYSGEGTGGGASDRTYLAAGGGGHGGTGGAGNFAGANGGSTYGSNTAPITFGSGGGATDTWIWSVSENEGGNGGGAISIQLTGNFNMTTSSTISADGQDGEQHVSFCGAGGAGGSIYINAGGTVSIVGSSNGLYARGGNGRTSSSTGRQCGGGGGGRIAVVRGSGSAFDAAKIFVTGGTSDNEAGADGTVHQSP